MPAQFAFFAYCDNRLTLYQDGNLFFNDTGAKAVSASPVFFPCKVTTIAVLCKNNDLIGSFAAKSYNTISDRLVTDDSWLVYNSTQFLTDNWYQSSYDDSSWRPATTFSYPPNNTWLMRALPELAVNDTYQTICQNPLDATICNTQYTNVYYRLKISKNIMNIGLVFT